MHNSLMGAVISNGPLRKVEASLKTLNALKIITRWQVCTNMIIYCAVQSSFDVCYGTVFSSPQEAGVLRFKESCVEM